jgi:hypothetical protein
MEAMEPMNIFNALFGIFRQRGLVTMIKEGRSLVGFTISAIIVSVIGGLLYGFAMGIGLGIETAIRDAIKVALIILSVLLFTIPVFWLSFRLLGREEKLGQVAVIPLTLVSSVSIILAITSPVVFLLSVLAGFSPEAVYIHIIIVDVAILVGLYLTGTLIYHGFSDQKRLIIPNVVGFLMMGVFLVVLLTFLSPFLALRTTFSVGTDRLKDGLGIGVAQKVEQSLAAASAADQVSYRYQSTNENGDLTRDYTVTRLGNDIFIEVHLQALPNEAYQNEGHIWVLDGQYYTDFEGGRVNQVDKEALASYLEPALAPMVFTLPQEFASASWRAYQSGNTFTATGTSPSMAQVTLVQEAGTGRMSSMTIGSAEKGLHVEKRVKDIGPAELDRAAMETSLNQAKVVGDIDRSDASMNDYVQEQAFFVVRYPRTWRSGSWSSSQRKVNFTTACGKAEGCPGLTVSVYDLGEGKGPTQYAEDLGRSLGLQPAYREIKVSTRAINGQKVGVVEYLFDQTVKGELKTTHHIEYIFEGLESRYHMDFSAPEAQFETNRDLFEEFSESFRYLQSGS